MIPLRDNIPSRTTPLVVYGILAANVLAFFLQQTDPNLAFHYGVKPAYLLAWFQDQSVAIYPYGRSDLLPIGVVNPSFGDVFLPYFTSMFLHGGLFHIGSNMLFLWIFADNVEDDLGHGTFLIFYLVCGLGASLIHTAVEFDSTVPTIGASGAIAGVLGGYLVRYPHARVLTLVPIFFFIHLMEIPALVFLVIWFVIQILQGVSGTAANVAVWAHAGGFVVGVLLMLVIPRGPHRNRRPPPYRDVPFEYVR